MTGDQLDTLIVRGVRAFESIAGSLERMAHPERVIAVGERRWWCALDNEFGNTDEHHPYCPGPNSSIRPNLHVNCGWGTWTREGQ